MRISVAASAADEKESRDRDRKQDRDALVVARDQPRSQRNAIAQETVHKCVVSFAAGGFCADQRS